MVDNSTTITLSKDAKRKLETIKEEQANDCSWTDFAEFVYNRFKNEDMADKIAKKVVRRLENDGYE